CGLHWCALSGLAEIPALAAAPAMAMPLLALFALGAGFSRRGSGLLAVLAGLMMTAAMTLMPRTAILAAAAGPPDFDQLWFCGSFGSGRSFRGRLGRSS